MRLLLLSLISCLLASCAGSKSYYVLTSDGPAPSGGGMAIGVGPVALAGYLDRPNLVFQETDHRLSVAEDHRWAGDLEENIARVTAANLGRLMHTGNVRTYPWGSDGELRYQVALDIRQLHGTQGGDAMIEASWRVYSLPDRRMITTRSWSGSEPARADGYDELVAAESRLLSRLAVEISKTLR